MKFGVNYRNFRTAIHGILIFNKREDAEEAYEALEYISTNDGIDDDFYDEEITRVAGESVDNIEEIDYRKITLRMSDIYDDEDVEIVNNVSVDLML